MKQFDIWLHRISLIVIIILTLIAVGLFASIYFLKVEVSQEPARLYLDADSTNATFAKNTQAEVKLIIKNTSKNSLDLSGFLVKLKSLPANAVQISFDPSFVPGSGWSWTPDSGWKDGQLTLAGSSFVPFILLPGQEKEIALLRFLPNRDFKIVFEKESIGVYLSSGRNVFNSDLTPDSQPYNLKE